MHYFVGSYCGNGNYAQFSSNYDPLNYENIKKNNMFDIGEGKTKTFKLGVPLLTRKKLRTLLTGKFKNNSTGLDLSICSGLPLVYNIDKKQTVTIEFAYIKVNSEIGSTVTLDKTIFVSVAETNFEPTSKSDYCIGTMNGGSKVALNQIEATNGRAKIVIDCEKDDSLWLRITNNKSGSEPGIYTKMSNLKVIGEFKN